MALARCPQGRLRTQETGENKVFFFTSFYHFSITILSFLQFNYFILPLHFRFMPTICDKITL